MNLRKSEGIHFKGGLKCYKVNSPGVFRVLDFWLLEHDSNLPSIFSTAVKRGYSIEWLVIGRPIPGRVNLTKNLLLNGVLTNVIAARIQLKLNKVI